MKIECISLSSSEDECDNLWESETTNYITNEENYNNAIDGDDYEALCTKIWVQCEFCDLVFDNRLTLIKHNASHIIIPLIKQTQQCTICQQHFTSTENLNTHVNESHVKVENISTKTDLLQSIIKKEIVVKCTDDFKDIFRVDKPLNLENDHNIRNRLLFEDDDEDEDFPMLNDLNGVQLNEPIKPLCDPIKSLYNPIDSLNQDDEQQLNGKQLLEEKKQERYDSGNLEEFYSKAIHYDSLIEKEEVSCRFCGKVFPNRFELVKHEPKHMKLRRFRHALCGFCERYIAGNYHNLRRHVDSKHPDKNLRKFNLHKCKKCHLAYFNHTKHHELYHATYKCYICYKSYENDQQLKEHKCEPHNGRLHNHNDGLHKDNDGLHKDNDGLHKDNEGLHNEKCETKSAIIKLCAMCYRFMKIYMQKRHNYVEMGELSELGTRQTCYKCNNKFFVVKLVERESLLREPHKPKKALSNADRLKRVQNRLKMIQYRNKF